jgi:hypothetical protein
MNQFDVGALLRGVNRLVSKSISQTYCESLNEDECVVVNAPVCKMSHLMRVEHGTSSNSGSSVRDTRTVSPVRAVQES